MNPKPEFAKLLRKRKRSGRPRKPAPPPRVPYAQREPDTAEMDRLDLQAHLIESHGTWIEGPLERVQAQHDWVHRFVRSQG